MKDLILVSILCIVGYNEFTEGKNIDTFSHSFRAGSKTYYISKSNVNFYQAYQYCRLQGMQLATITNQDETSAIDQELLRIDAAEIGYYWIAANRLGNEVDWFWLSTGKFVTYTNWANTEPNNLNIEEYCVFIGRLDSNTTYQWGDGRCFINHFIICETAECI